jgi:hypothetical protein
MAVHSARRPASRASGGHSELEVIVCSPTIVSAGLIRQMYRSCMQELLTSVRDFSQESRENNRIANDRARSG